MLVAILLLLIVFWFLGYGPLDALAFPLFEIRGQIVDLWDLLIFFVILWLIGALPTPLRQIAAIGLGLWLLSLFGFIAIAGMANTVLIAIILGTVLSFAL